MRARSVILDKSSLQWFTALRHAVGAISSPVARRGAGRSGRTIVATPDPGRTANPGSPGRLVRVCRESGSSGAAPASTSRLALWAAGSSGAAGCLGSGATFLFPSTLTWRDRVTRSDRRIGEPDEVWRRRAARCASPPRASREASSGPSLRLLVLLTARVSKCSLARCGPNVRDVLPGAQQVRSRQALAAALHPAGSAVWPGPSPPTRGCASLATLSCRA